MITETTEYTTIDGDMLDAICAAHYDGDTSMLPAVLALNAHLSAAPPVLGSGVLILLPPGRRPVRETARLWD
jgi:phage tail protein X